MTLQKPDCPNCKLEMKETILHENLYDQQEKVNRQIDKLFWICINCNQQIPITKEERREHRLFGDNITWREEERQRLSKSAQLTVQGLQAQKIDRESHFTRPRSNADIQEGYCNRCGMEKLRGGTGKIEYFCQTCWDDQLKVGTSSQTRKRIDVI